jgi:hypothetical protein
MEQATQLLEFLGNTLAGITQIGERQQFLSDDINARVKSLWLRIASRCRSSVACWWTTRRLAISVSMSS